MSHACGTGAKANGIVRYAAAIALLVTAVLGIAGYVVQNKARSGLLTQGSQGAARPFVSSLPPPCGPLGLMNSTRFPLYLHAIAW